MRIEAANTTFDLEDDAARLARRNSRRRQIRHKSDVRIGKVVEENARRVVATDESKQQWQQHHDRQPTRKLGVQDSVPYRAFGLESESYAPVFTGGPRETGCVVIA